MDTYELTVHLEEKDLKTIRTAGQKLVIIKENDDNTRMPAHYRPGDMEQDVPWITFHPLTTNTVSWEQTYDIFPSASNAMNGTAMPAACNISANRIPVVKVKIFLAASADDGKVISVTQSKTLTVDFTEKTTRTVKYDQSADAFVAVD